LVKCVVIIPALNEEDSIVSVIKSIPSDIISEVIVVDNNSSDNTSLVAKKCGATVLFEEKKGYGAACLKGIRYAEDADVIFFMDADASDDPSYFKKFFNCVVFCGYDMVIGNRLSSPNLGVIQKFGTKLALFLIKVLFFKSYKDLGPFRAVKKQALDKLSMNDKTWGWTVEMAAKAAKKKLKVKEIDVSLSYRKRFAGVSKISGNFKGIFKAGIKIIYSCFKYRFID
jgi:glycosyltransferase involved in cell wall biosynthesis